MNKIEFRIWDNKFKHMDYSTEDIFINGEGKIYEMESETVMGEPWQDMIGKEEYESMQYIGKTDRNNIKAFEGDIIKHYFMAYKGYGSVEEECEIEVIQSINMTPFDDSSVGFEIIGNIYQNPDIIE